MKELFNKFNDDDLDLQTLKKEDDPLWDESKPVLLGYAFYKLEPVSYLMSNQSVISIVSPNGNVVGKIEVDIIPHDENGNEYDEVPEVPSELIGQSLLYKVVIMNLKNLSKNFCNNIRVEYQCFYDHSIMSTKVYNPFNEKNDETVATNNTDSLENNNNSGEDGKVEIEINETFEHKIDYLTKEDIDFLENDKVCFKIYASERVEKKGKTPIEEVLNAVKEHEDLKEPEEEIKAGEDNKNTINGEQNGAKKEDDEPVDEMKNNKDKDKNKDKGKDNKKGTKDNDKKKGKKKGDNKEDCLIY
jgi:predicted transcriptional regulator